MSAGAPGRLAGAASAVHVLFFKEVSLLSGTSGTKARQSLACSVSACATLNEPRDRSLAGHRRGRGSLQKFVAQSRLRGTCWRRPRAASPGTERLGPHRTALRRSQAQGSSPLGYQDSQPRNRRTDSPTALAATSSQPPGGLGCAPRDVAGAASAPGASARDAPRPAHFPQLSFLCRPQPGRQCRCSCHLGHPSYCSGPAAVPALREERPCPRWRRCGGPGQLAPRGGEALWHREKLLGGAEAVGGGRRRWVGEAIALLSPKSKVLGAVSRTPSGGSRGRLLRAGLRLLQETRQPAPARWPPPPRRDECA